MIEALRDFLLTRIGRIAAVAAIFATGGVLVWSWNHNLGAGDADVSDHERTFIDATNGKVFHAKIHVGEKIPIRSPLTGRHTGYPVAWSWWSKDGKPLQEPEPVLLKSWLGKRGPTFAPQSNRLVIMNEQRPEPGARPPPTKEEYEKMIGDYGKGAAK